MSDPIVYKTCSDCKATFDRTIGFARHPGHRDGYKSKCKVCCKKVIDAAHKLEYPGDSYIYFVLASEVCRVKIGWSSNPTPRFINMRVENACLLTVIKVIEGTEAQEKQLHQQFANERHHGEWFTYSTRLQQFIEDCNGVEVINPPPDDFHTLPLWGDID